MSLTHIAIALSIGGVLFLINFIVAKADKAMEESQEERMARLVAGMRARRGAQGAHPARRQGDFTHA